MLKSYGPNIIKVNKTWNFVILFKILPFYFHVCNSFIILLTGGEQKSNNNISR